MLVLADKHPNRRSFSDFLPWALEIDDGVILCKDGGFMAAFDVQAPDFNSLSEEARDYIQMTFVAAVGQLDDRGWSLWFEYIREPLPNLKRSEFPDPVTQAIDDARVDRFNQTGIMFNATLSLVVRWSPPKNTESRLADTVTEFAVRIRQSLNRKQQPMSTGDVMFDERLKTFIHGLSKFEDAATDAVGLTRLKTVALPPTGIAFSPFEALLAQCIYGFGKVLSYNPPDDPLYLDVKLAVADFYAGTEPHIDGKEVAVMSVDGFPSETSTGMLQHLAGLPVEYRWSTRFIVLSQEESTAEMKRHRNKWEQASSSFIAQFLGKEKSGHKATMANIMIADTDDAAVEASQGFVRYGYLSSVFVFRADNRKELNRLVRSLRGELAKSGCIGRIERENASDAFLGSFPGMLKANIRRPLMHTMHLFNLIPMTNPWAGSPDCPSPLIEGGKGRALMRVCCEGATAFDLNLHVSDVGHTLVFGATGSGKSVLLAMLAAQWRRYKDARVIVFDKGQSIRALTTAVGGVWRELGFESKKGFRPLEVLAGNDDELSQGDRVWIAEWITDIARLNKVEPNAEQRRLISEGVRMLAPKGESRTMLDLRVSIQDQAISEVLQRYSSDGDYADLFDWVDDDSDHPTANDAAEFDSDFICYELDELHTLPPEAVLPLLLFIFRAIENSATGAPTLILLDEAWSLLAHPVFAEKIREWLKVMRKKNVAVVMATQSLSDAISSGLLDVLLESCPTKLFGANPEAESEAVRDNYMSLGLTGADIHVVSRLRRKREYYVTAGTDRRVIDLALGDDELRWVGVSDPRRIAELIALKRDEPDNWRALWQND